MQPRHGGAQISGRADVLEHVVGSGQTLRPRGLRSHDAQHFVSGQAAARHDPKDLLLFRAIDEQQAVDSIGIRTRFDEQRHHQQHVGRIARRGAARVAFGPDQGMQDRLKAGLVRGVGKRQRAHRGPIQRAVGADHGGTEFGKFGLQGRQGGAARGRQLAGDRIGIDHRHALRSEEIGHRALTAADAAKDVAMHIAAMKPVALTSAEVPADLIEKERSVAAAKAEESGKPAEIAAKMVEGAVQKYLKEVSLADQVFVKAEDGKQTVGAMLKAKNTTIKAFTLYVVGEGIEKKADDFAAEVAAQMAAAKGA